MRTRTTMVLSVIVLATALCTLPAHGNHTDATATKTKLAVLVDDYIACCDAKSAMRNSRSENIRRTAMRSRMKAAYFIHAKEELVEEMIESNIEPKAYKVRLFLNEKFHITLLAIK